MVHIKSFPIHFQMNSTKHDEYKINPVKKDQLSLARYQGATYNGKVSRSNLHCPGIKEQLTLARDQGANLHWQGIKE